MYKCPKLEELQRLAKSYNVDPATVVFPMDSSAKDGCVWRACDLISDTGRPVNITQVRPLVEAERHDVSDVYMSICITQYLTYHARVRDTYLRVLLNKGA